MPYVPGKSLVLSRLPAQEWFTAEEAAAASGWSRTFINARIRDGKLVAQQWQPDPDQPQVAGPARLNCRTYKIHVDDLALFIMLNGRGRYTEAKPINDVIMIVRSWPRWLLRHLHTALGRLLAKEELPPTDT